MSISQLTMVMCQQYCTVLYIACWTTYRGVTVFSFAGILIRGLLRSWIAPFIVVSLKLLNQ